MIKIPELRRIGLRIPRCAKGRILVVCNSWRNAEDGAIDKQGWYFNHYRLPEPDGIALHSHEHARQETAD